MSSGISIKNESIYSKNKPNTDEKVKQILSELNENQITNIIFENEKKKEPELEVEAPKLPRTGF